MVLKMKIRHAILEISNQPFMTKSAIIINNEIAITSGCILVPYVRPIAGGYHEAETKEYCVSTKIIRNLQQCQLINVQDASTDEARYLDALTCHIMFECRKKVREPYMLRRNRAKILYLFSSVEIARYFHTFLNSTSSIRKSDDNGILLSSFLVLSIRANREQESFERFLLHIDQYLRYLYPVQILDDVLSISTPFGLENFYKTTSIGKVSKVIGHECSLFVISNSLPVGCEGSAVFNNKMRLIGIIISTSFMFQCGNVNLTLAANISLLLRDFVKKLGVKMVSLTVPSSSKFAWEATMVVIEAAGNQGTGTIVKVQKKNYIITCSHLLFQADSKVLCRSIDGEFQSKVLWYNPQYNQPFDIALLAVSDSIPDRYCAHFSTIKPHLGQVVYNAGFPHFVNFNLKYDFNPSIYEGRIIKCDPGAIMSDGCVLAGQSGGPMFDRHGRILGICVSNVKMDDKVYPNVNMAVPLCEIREVLEDYAKRNDPDTLSRLVANQETQKLWTIKEPYILSKL